VRPRAEEPHVAIADLGAWGAAWLAAEYDPEADAIRIDARAVALIATALGRAEAERFVACATAHERFHRAYPEATEAEARAHAAASSGADAERYERILRAAARR
jgi:hypothetical protein